jgi:hypothetical protein
VGKPGEAIKRVIEENNGQISTIVMIDAALKLEGEKPGEVAEGIGAAIGGPGTEAYKIEESIVKHEIPLHAVIIKQDIGDAVSPMRKEIFDATEGDNVIIAGIGNTIGVGQ